jgi:hypothetical protein
MPGVSRYLAYPACSGAPIGRESKSILIQHIDVQEGANHVNDATGHPTRSRDYRGVCC